jgi:beta-xylosidase
VRLKRWAGGLAVIALVAGGLAVGGLATSRSVAGAQISGGLIVWPSGSSAFDGDAPDPNVVRDGSNYYAFTTGTVLGNHIQALVDTTGSPQSGWRSYTGTKFGSTALPEVPAWEQIDTQTSPGVFHWAGKWIMYYDAALSGHAGDTGFNCLSVATTASLSPAPVFTDRSSQPLLCQSGLGGSIDPSPFVDPVTGHAYLVWKSNDGGSLEPSWLWSQQLSADGMSLVGTPHQLLPQDANAYPWETTIENPDMVNVGGNYFLLFSTGIWNSPSYSEAYATCAGPDGPCSQISQTPALSSYGSAAGPGGGSLFQDTMGNWMAAYAAWRPNCTDYSCGGGASALRSPGLADPSVLWTHDAGHRHGVDSGR